MAKTDKTAVQEQNKVLKEQYEEVFNSDEAKIKIFDAVAKNYFAGNFGTMRKSDFELLLFSSYLDQMIENMSKALEGENEEKQAEIFKKFRRDTSDIALSSQLGVTTSTIGSLKTKKNIRFPNPSYDWRELFKQILPNARVDEGKVVMYIPDRSLFQELKKFIELNDGYVIEDLPRTNLLKLSPEHFIRLLIEVEAKDNKELLEQKFAEYVKQNEKEIEKLKLVSPDLTIYDYVKLGGKAALTEGIKEIVKAFCPGGSLAVDFVEKIIDAIQNAKEE